MRVNKLYVFSFLGIAVGLEPVIFYIPFDFVFRVNSTHLSLGNWIALFLLPIVAVYNFIVATYLMFKAGSDSYMVLIFFALFFIQSFLTLNEYGLFG